VAVKRYIDDEWVTISGLEGPVGETGPAGPSGVFRGNSAPEDTSLLWVDLDDLNSFVPYLAPTLGSTSIDSDTTYTNISGLTINSTTIPTSKTLVVTTDKLNVHAATTSAELAGIISDETGSGALVFGTSPTLTTPVLGSATGTSLELTVSSGTTVPLTIQNNGTGNSFVVNDVASDTTPFVVDADGNVGIGQSVPTTKLEISSSSTVAAGSPSLLLTGSNNTERIEARSIGADSAFRSFQSAGSVGSPSAVTLGMGLGNYQLGGYDGTAWQRAAWMRGEATENWSATNRGTAIIFSTTPNGSTTIAERMRIDASGNTTINAIADATTTTAARGAGYMGVPQSAAATTGAYTIVAADAGEHIYSTATRTVTIPANGSVAFPVGTAITFIAATGTTVTIAITTDTLLLAGAGTTGSRTLAPFGMATAIKITSTSWIISGNGLT
jgi:hypothetical protein